MMYNADFLIAAVVILLLVLRNFLDQKRAEDLNSRVFLFFAVIGILDVIAELVSNYYITSGDGDFGLAAVVTTTIFYLFQALLPYALLCYIMTLHDNKLMQLFYWPVLCLPIPLLKNCFILMYQPDMWKDHGTD